MISTVLIDIYIYKIISEYNRNIIIYKYIAIHLVLYTRLLYSYIIRSTESILYILLLINMAFHSSSSSSLNADENKS